MTAHAAAPTPGHAPVEDAQSAAILEAARHLLATEGAAALTIRRIAAEAGWSTMGVYSRFGGKDGIVDRLYADGFAELARRMRAVPQTDDPLADLLRLGVAYREAALASATTYEVMFHDVVPGFEPSPATSTAAAAVFGDLVERVQRAIDAGALVDHGAEAIALALWSTSHGFVSLEIHARASDDEPMHALAAERERVFHLACESLLRGLSSPHHDGTSS